MWSAIRRNRRVNNEHVTMINAFAQNLMVEAAQVAAMAAKYEAMLERNKNKEE